jgi:hypothetical protein
MRRLILAVPALGMARIARRCLLLCPVELFRAVRVCHPLDRYRLLSRLVAAAREAFPAG